MKKTSQIQIRTDNQTKEKLILKAKENGFKDLSSYLIFIGLRAKISYKIDITSP